jgi:uncharacterized protein (TIGR03086 family)
MTTQLLERAFASTRSVLVNVQPDDLALPTPCASWDVRALLNHIVGGTYYFAAVVNDGKAPDREDVDYTSADMIERYDAGIAAAIAAFGAPGAMEKMVTLPFATLPVSVFIGIAATDAFSHGWDLARATGQSSDLDPELAAALLERARALLPDALRGPDRQAPFGPRVEPTAPGCAADDLAAFLGRAVA